MVKLVSVTGTAPFRPRARLIRLLGDELISDEVMAIIELVKNAYDADARTVIVRLEALDDPALAAIEIRDDGIGMPLDTVLHAWLEPGTDFKRRGGRKARTALGRFPLGEKGVGRFAADKLGARTELVTRPVGETDEILVDVHWDRFDGGGYLDQVENRWRRRPPRIFIGDDHGVVVRSGALRTTWDLARLTRLRDSLGQLVSPFAKRPDFRIVLDCPGFPEVAGQVTSRLLEHAPYRLCGRVDARGRLYPDSAPDAPVDLTALGGGTFLAAGGARPPRCGPFRISLFVWDLDSSGLRQAGMDRPLREALKRASGVSIYRDDFRVLPYGTAGDDWLELNQRRVNNPTLRVSTNQLVGVVEIAQEDNPGLRDRTSREGLVDAPALHDLKALLLSAIAHLEEQRFAVRPRLHPEVAASDTDDPVLAAVKLLREGSLAGAPSARLLDRLSTTYRQQVVAMAAREEWLTRLADTGVAAGLLVPELNRTLYTASTTLRIVRNLAGHGGVGGDITRQLERLDAELELLDEQFDAIEPLYATKKTSGDTVDLRSAVQQATTVFAFRLRELGVQPVLDPSLSVTVRMGHSHLLQVLLHLFDNALHWLAKGPVELPRAIQVHPLEDGNGFIFADSGPGVPTEHRERIFLPFFTRRADGNGLGLHLVRSILDRYGHTVELLDAPLILPGANFRVIFSS